MSRERLPDPPPAPPSSPRPPSWGALLFRPEPLPDAPPVAPPGGSRTGRSLLAAILAPEPLARDPEFPPRPRRNWLAFLLAPERLDAPGHAGPEVH